MKTYIGITHLTEKFADKEGLSRKESNRILTSVFDLVKAELQNNEHDGIQLIDFITLEKVVRKEKLGRNPKDISKTYKIPSCKSIKLKLGKAFSEELNK